MAGHCAASTTCAKVRSVHGMSEMNRANARPSHLRRFGARLQCNGAPRREDGPSPRKGTGRHGYEGRHTACPAETCSWSGVALRVVREPSPRMVTRGIQTMIEIDLDIEDLVGVRFAMFPAMETVTS